MMRSSLKARLEGAGAEGSPEIFDIFRTFAGARALVDSIAFQAKCRPVDEMISTH